MDNTGRRNLLIAIIVTIAIIAGITLSVISSRASRTREQTDVTSEKYDVYDKSSGQTTSNPPGKSPEKYGSKADTPIFLGTATLLDYGVSAMQEADMRYALFQYLKSISKPTAEVSIVTSTVRAADRDPSNESSVFKISFDIVINKKDKYKVQMDYFDLDSIVLRLYNSAGTKLLFDSGTVTNQHI